MEREEQFVIPIECKAIIEQINRFIDPTALELLNNVVNNDEQDRLYQNYVATETAKKEIKTKKHLDRNGFSKRIETIIGYTKEGGNKECEICGDSSSELSHLTCCCMEGKIIHGACISKSIQSGSIPAQCPFCRVEIDIDKTLSNRPVA